MSNSMKLEAELIAKGWRAIVWYEKPNYGVPFGGTGGYYLNITNYDSAQLKGINGFWLGYDFPSALAETKKYPTRLTSQLVK